MSTADYIISRAGANSIFEFLALKKPTLLIPLSKKSSRGDQILNSKSFEKEGYSLMLEEEDIKGDILNKKILELKERKIELINNMERSQSKNGVEAIIKVLLENIRN
jgi:UDP-N-acetylglucosamine--N-acetylmuramyl-(pentapeptide) pyrophosphoryl-undecaprenol N-acetylglucosamine transferase